MNSSGNGNQIERDRIAAVLYSAIGSLLLAYAGWSYVVTRLGAARAGATMHLMPAIAVLLSMLLLTSIRAGTTSPASR